MTIREALKKRRMTLTELSAVTGLSLAFVSRVASGDRRPSPEAAAAIEQALGGMITRLELLYPKDAA